MNINLLAILAVGIVNMVVGSLWYGPLFGKKWMQLSGHNPQHKSMTKSYMLGFMGALIMGYVMSYLIGLSGASSFMSGAQVGFWAWLGFIVPVEMGSVLWDGKSWKLFWLNALYYLVVLKLMGGVLAVWS